MPGRRILGNRNPHQNQPGKAVASCLIAGVIWILTCVGIWMLAKADGYVDDTEVALILGGLQLAMMIYPMIEYLFFFRKDAGIVAHPYNPWICLTITPIYGLIAIAISNAVCLELGWITLLQFVSLMLVLILPRVIKALRP